MSSPERFTTRYTASGRIRPAAPVLKPTGARLVVRGLLAMGAALTLASCAHAPDSPESIVRKRAQARLDAMVAGQYEAAYGFLSPASRAVVSFDAWRNNLPRATVWKAANVHAVTCEVLDRCKSTVVIRHQPLVMGASMGTIETALDEIWVLDAGLWWMLHLR